MENYQKYGEKLKMNFNEYQKLARRTGVIPSSPGPYKNEFYFELHHMLMGLDTESGELSELQLNTIYRLEEIDIVNLSEELADIMWYIANFFESQNCNIEEKVSFLTHSFNIKNISLDQFQEYCYEVNKGNRAEQNFIKKDVYDVIYHSCELNHLIGDVTNIVKKHVFYGIELNRDSLMYALTGIVCVIAAAFESFDLSMSEALEKNIKKLKIRFPENFNEAHALSRDTKKEREVLEKGES